MNPRHLKCTLLNVFIVANNKCSYQTWMPFDFGPKMDVCTYVLYLKSAHLPQRRSKMQFQTINSGTNIITAAKSLEKMLEKLRKGDWCFKIGIFH